MGTDYIGYGIAAFFGLFTIWFFLLSRKQKRPYWTYRNNYIIGKTGEGISGIRILFSDKEVKQVTASKVFLWNKGRDAIKEQDIPKSDLVRLVFPKKIEILDIKLLNKSRDSISVELEKIDTEQNHIINCNFNFLDKNDGFVLEILHTGGRDTQIEMAGTILGATKGFAYIKSLTKYRDTIENCIFLSLMIFVGLILVGKNISFLKPILTGPKTNPVEIILTIASSIGIVVLINILLMKLERKNNPYRKLWE